jgi:hypothetical protein
MQVTSLLSRREDAHDPSCSSCGHDHHDHGHGHDHEHAVLPLAQTLVGVVFIINSFVMTWIFADPPIPSPPAAR